MFSCFIFAPAHSKGGTNLCDLTCCCTIAARLLHHLCYLTCCCTIKACLISRFVLAPAVKAWHFSHLIRLSCCSIELGLARTVYIHRIWPYIWWFPCQIYRIYTVFIWFWPTLDWVCLPLIAAQLGHAFPINLIAAQSRHALPLNCCTFTKACLSSHLRCSATRARLPSHFHGHRQVQKVKWRQFLHYKLYYVLGHVASSRFLLD